MKTENLADRAEEALQEREITFAALAKVAPVGIVRFDALGRCNYVNDRWSEIAGLTIDEAIGDGWQRAVHPDDRKTVAGRWRRMQEGIEGFREEYRIRRPDGEVRWVLAEGAELRSYSGELIGFIRTLTDITVHRQLEAELLEARRELEARVAERTAALVTEMSERAKLEKEVLEAKENEQRRFSHDLHDGLGQSLTGIVFRALALERDLAAEQSPHAGKAAKIVELVNATNNQAHNLAHGIHPVPPRPDGLMRALAELAEQASQSYLTDCVFECEEPIHVSDHSMATHLYRIAQESLTNAMKHGRAGKVSICLEQRANACALMVRDNGAGLSREALASSGRGLNIMRHRARMVDASLELCRAPDGGTIVECVFLPR